MKRAVFGAALGLSLFAAAPAMAENQVITGNDQLTWDKPNVSVLPDETVTWTFPGTAQLHHVQSNGADVAEQAWTDFKSAFGAPAPDVSFTFKTPGTYKFVCSVHADTMFGTVSVGTAPPPPPAPLPLSQQPLNNDDAGLVTLERVSLDKAKPKLSSFSAKRAARGAVRVRFSVNEDSVVLVSLKRGGKTVKKTELAGSGVGSVTLRGAKAGRYSVQVRATDLAGNASTVKKTLTVR